MVRDSFETGHKIHVSTTNCGNSTYLIPFVTCKPTEWSFHGVGGEHFRWLVFPGSGLPVWNTYLQSPLLLIDICALNLAEASFCLDDVDQVAAMCAANRDIKMSLSVVNDYELSLGPSGVLTTRGVKQNPSELPREVDFLNTIFCFQNNDDHRSNS